MLRDTFELSAGVSAEARPTRSERTSRSGASIRRICHFIDSFEVALPPAPQELACRHEDQHQYAETRHEPPETRVMIARPGRNDLCRYEGTTHRIRAQVAKRNRRQGQKPQHSHGVRRLLGLDDVLVCHIPEIRYIANLGQLRATLRCLTEAWKGDKCLIHQELPKSAPPSAALQSPPNKQ